MKEAIETIKPFVHHVGLSGEAQARAQYEFGRLTATHARRVNNSEALHEGIYDVQRATEDTPKGSPLWECRQEVFQDLLEAFRPDMPGVGLNALIRSAKAQVAAAAAMKKPDLHLLLEMLSSLHDRRYRLRHTIDDLHDSHARMKEAAEANPSPSVMSQFVAAGDSVVRNINLFWDDDDDPKFAEAALHDGKKAMELIDQLPREKILNQMHPTAVGSIFQSTATAYRLKYDGDGEGDEGVGDVTFLEACIATLEKGVAFLEACNQTQPTRKFVQSLQGDIVTHRKTLDKLGPSSA